MRNALGRSENEKADKISGNSSSSSNSPLPKSLSGFGQPAQSQSPLSNFNQPMNPLAARFASLAAAQKKNNDDKKS